MSEDEYAIPLKREDIELTHPEIEERLTKLIKSTDCYVQYDLCGLFILIEFALNEQKIERQKIIEIIKKIVQGEKTSIDALRNELLEELNEKS